MVTFVNTSSYRNYSAAGRVDVSAPGTNLLSTWVDDYRTPSGTSMAAPVVSGVAALALDRFDFDGPAEVKRHLTATADDIGLRAQEAGAGRIDAEVVNVTVVSWKGAGDYELRITEYGR